MSAQRVIALIFLVLAAFAGYGAARTGSIGYVFVALVLVLIAALVDGRIRT